MNAQFNEFIEQIKLLLSEDIISLFEFGSKEGERDLKTSDIDICIITKDSQSSKKIMGTIKKLEKEIFHISHSKVFEYLEKTWFFGSYNGLHIILISQNEFSNSMQPKSFRLKFISFLLGPNMLLYNLKKQARVLIGQNIFENVPIQKLTFFDRLSVFAPSGMILIALPFLRLKKDVLKIWCFKAVKSHAENMLAYSKLKFGNETIQMKDLENDFLIIQKAMQYRYFPEKFSESSVKLYLDSWGLLMHNLPFLFKDKISLKR